VRLPDAPNREPAIIVSAVLRYDNHRIGSVRAPASYDRAMQPEDPSVVEPSAIEYDVWRWHTEGAFPKDQPPEQGYVHIGVFVAWLALHDMLDPGWVAGSGAGQALAAIRKRSGSPCALRDLTDGRLTSDMLTAEGQGFASAYYAPEYGYAHDWRRVFGRRADRYAIPDGWETYDGIEALISRRYRQWIEAGRPELMPLSRPLSLLLRLARSRTG
jgi:hypothetical protein